MKRFSLLVFSMLLLSICRAAESPLIIHVDAAKQSVKPGESVAWYVTAAGSEPLQYQWKKDGQPIKGAVKSTYKIAAAKATDSGIYSCTVKNEGGSISTSEYVFLVKQSDAVAQKKHSPSSMPAAIRN